MLIPNCAFTCLSQVSTAMYLVYILFAHQVLKAYLMHSSDLEVVQYYISEKGPIKGWLEDAMHLALESRKYFLCLSFLKPARRTIKTPFSFPSVPHIPSSLLPLFHPSPLRYATPTPSALLSTSALSQWLHLFCLPTATASYCCAGHCLA